MPCRCCNWSGGCATTATCAPGRVCCNGECRAAGDCVIAIQTDTSQPGNTRYYFTDSTGARVYQARRGEDMAVTVTPCGIPPGTMITVRINHITTSAADFWYAGAIKRWVPPYFSEVIGQTSGELPVEADGTASVLVLTEYQSLNSPFTVFFELEFYLPSGAMSCKQKVRLSNKYTPYEDLGACCINSINCGSNFTSGQCITQGGQWYPGLSCADIDCSPSTPVPACGGGATRVTSLASAIENPSCVIAAYGGRVIGIPTGCTWINISGTADDLLLVDGYVRGRNSPLDGRRAGESGSVDGVCANPANVNYTFSKTGSFSVGAGDTRGGAASYDLTITFSDASAFSVSSAMQSAGGPGTELKALLAKVGITATPDCSCNKRAKEMDDNGVQWCRENEELILSWLKEESDRRGLPFVALAAKMLIRRAVRNAEKKANSQ